jgi:anti-sigma regulatory factor (Ser/Thr protein kinase)
MFECHLPLASDIGSARLGRQAVRDLLIDCDPEFVERAVILTDELVTNAIRHGRPPIVLDLAGSADTLDVGVCDAGSGVPGGQAVEWTEERGRGLMIVAALADEWGVCARQQGKCVWFHLELNSVGSAVAG